ncbi:7023_t:CDS:2 [Funneliformis caledonium]|uniref:7023_t:CDS:1 n=1 Tax=Funneliformis caledonium TaxID=1117310 RepID=A0A9N9N6P1_9GLOM|nr:7023_t:CDS:2 [Funneliformis caledonium]
MQVEGSDPPIKFFLPDDNEYDSEETLDLFGYDLVKMLDEEQNKTLSSDIEMEEDDDVLLEEEDKNLITHDELSNCKYSGEGQQSIKVFFKPKKSKNEDENIIVKKVPYKDYVKKSIENMYLIVLLNLEDQLDLT